MVGLTYHAHVSAKIGRASVGDGIGSPLTQRERQCLAWISDGKTMQILPSFLMSRREV